MATTSATGFSSLLKVYMPYDLLVEEMKEKNYFWSNVKKDSNWFGGTLDVPFEGQEYSSLAFGALTSSSDVGQMKPILGTISTLPELWGTMVFYEKDLDSMGNLEASFLKAVPGKINQFVNRMAESISLTLLNGCLATVTNADNAATGVFIVDHPEHFTIDQKVTIDDDNSSGAEFYVTAINMATKAITLATARAGSTYTNLTDYTVAQNAKIYVPYGEDSGFTSLRSSLLSASNGGSSTLYGQTKTAYPYLQAYQHDGSGMTAANTLEKFYDFFYDTMSLGKGQPTEILMSMKHFKNCAKALEVSRQFNVGDKKAGYGFASIDLVGNAGGMKLTGIRDMNDSEAFIMDWSKLKFHGNSFFERKRHFNGEEYFLERGTSGYVYIVDIKFSGDLVVNGPSAFGVIHSIPSSIT